MKPVNTSSLLLLAALCLALNSPALGASKPDKGIGRELLIHLKTLRWNATCNGTFFNTTDVGDQSHICFIQELDLVEKRCTISNGTEDDWLDLVYDTRIKAKVFLPGGHDDPSRSSTQCAARRPGTFNNYIQKFERCVMRVMNQ